MNIRAYRGVVPTIAASAWVDESAVVIGDVELGERVSVWPCSVIRGDIHSIRIGAYSNVQDGSVLHVSRRSEAYPDGFPLLVGARVTVGHRVVLHGCTIGDHCLIGMGSVILDGALLEEQVMVAAGAVVPPGKTLESGYLYAGNPIKQLRKLQDRDLAMIARAPDRYAEIIDDYR